MGHAKCGGFTSLLGKSRSATTNSSTSDEPACRAKAEVDRTLPDADPDERQRACEMWGVRFSLDNLMGCPWIREAVERGELLLHGLYFDMGTGELLADAHRALRADGEACASAGPRRRGRR